MQPETDLPGSELNPLESLDDSNSEEESSDKDGSSGGGMGHKSAEVSSTGGGSGNRIGISACNGSGSSGTCASSQSDRISRGWRGSASEADLSGSK